MNNEEEYPALIHCLKHSEVLAAPGGGGTALANCSLAGLPKVLGYSHFPLLLGICTDSENM